MWQDGACPGPLQRHGDGRGLDVGGLLVGMAGTLFLLGYDGLAWVLGWTGGFVLVSILIGPYLRKFGAYTVPDFMAFRFGGNTARVVAVIMLVACSFTL